MDARLKGQEVEIRVVASGTVVQEISAIASFNDNVKLELKEDGFLGEVTNRYDEILNGFGGDLEFQVTQATWYEFVNRITDRAQRKTPEVVFNVIRVDFFANGQSAIVTYEDVKWGPIPSSVASRGDFVKPRLEFGCSTRSVQINALL